MQKLKILVVGSNLISAIERYYIRYMREGGAEVELYAAPDIIYSYHSKNLVNKVLFKSRIGTGYRKVNAELIEKAEAFRPDWIWVWKGMEIFPATLKQLKTKFKLANYNPDHPFILSGSGSGNKNVLDSIGLYDLHFCYNSLLQERIRLEYNLPTVYLPFGFDLPEQEYQDTLREPELVKTCFLGNPDAIRVATIQSVVNRGIPVDLFGHEWEKTTLNGHPLVQIGSPIYGAGFWKILRKYRVQLNIFRRHNDGSHNMRTFEIPAVGGVQLAPFSSEQEVFFKTGEEIFYYNNPEELEQRLRSLLAISPEATEVIRAAARTRSLESGYSYKDRAGDVLKVFRNQLHNERAPHDSIAVAIYSHPTYYPPLLNAIDALSGQYKNVFVISRNLGTPGWSYPSNVKVTETGHWRQMRAAEISPTSWKIQSFIKFYREFRRLLIRERPRWIMANDPISLWALQLLLPSLRYAPKVWYHSHDITETDGLRKFSVGYFAARAENPAFKTLDLFTLPASDRISFYPVIMMKGLFKVVPNYPALSRMPMPSGSTRTNAEPLKLIYQGRVSDEHGLEELIGYLQTDDSVTLTIIGPGPDDFIARLHEMIAAGRLAGRVQIRPPVNYSELQAITAAHDAGWAVNEPVNLLYQTAGVASNKIYEYAACGLPIIYFRDVQYEKYLGNFAWAFSTDLSSQDLAGIFQQVRDRHTELSAAARNSFLTKLNFGIAFRDVLEVLA